MKRVVVIGAGVGGLTTASVLARAGLDVTLLEAHVYPGGCAGTFYHKKYKFDAGATLAGGFYPGGPMDRVAQAVGIQEWPVHASNPAMVVHLPCGRSITRWTDERRHEERRRAFGEKSDCFWKWQEDRADALWDLAMRFPQWPPQTVSQGLGLINDGARWLVGDLLQRLNPGLWKDAFRPVSSRLCGASEELRVFVDAQLLIAAQTTSQYANALYGASALDLPRRGVVHVEGGIGGISLALANALRGHGGNLHYKQEVSRIVMENGRPVAVETKRGESVPADIVVANLPPWNIAELTEEHAPSKLKKLPPQPKDGWGAFMVYMGVDASAIPDDFPLHHQVVLREPMGETNTVFLSLCPKWDRTRGPKGYVPLTISTHTELAPWWDLHASEPAAYEARKNLYADKMIEAASYALPNLREAANLILPGTPVTFRRFTRRAWGWVGGFPQTNLFTAWGPRLSRDLWMVGDSIFPGQSTAAVAMGGMRVAYGILGQLGYSTSLSSILGAPPSECRRSS